MKRTALAVVSMAVLAWAGSARAETVKLELRGTYWPGCAGKIGKALGEVPGVKVEGNIKATKEEPQLVSIDLDTSKSDVGDVGKAVANTDTPHKAQHPPSAAVVVPVKGLSADGKDKVQKALAEVKGVVTKDARAEKGQAIVPLDAKGGAKMSEIKKALSKLAAD